MASTTPEAAAGVAAPSNTTPKGHTYKFSIKMNCTGCSGAIERILAKLDGVASYTVSLEDQSAEVITTAAASTAAQALQMELGFQTVLEKIRRSGKIVTAAVVDGVEVEV